MILLVLLGVAQGFYLPGVAPREYVEGEPVDLKVNKLESVETQLPYAYYDLPFCQPENIVLAAENLGEVLTGEVIENSIFSIQMLENEACKVQCRMLYSYDDVHKFQKKIAQEYRVNFIVDNLPAATKYRSITPDEKGHEIYVYEKGYALGFKSEQRGHTRYYMNNHVDLILKYHQDQSYTGARIVGFEVQARSIKHSYTGEWKDGNPPLEPSACSEVKSGHMDLDMKKDSKEQKEVIWTYGVFWEQSPVKWASRWDAYFKMQDPQIHWFSIMNSFMIVLFLTGMVAMILMRALHKDFRRYNQHDEEALEAQQEETGWKLVHGDVFRPPANKSLFASFVGTGVQIFTMVFLTLIFAALGFLSPANRGALMTTLLLLFVFMGVFAGYYSARIYKMFGQTDWRANTLMTALLFPAVVFTVFFILNLFVWGKKSSGAVPFATMFALLVLWFGISVPLVYLGAFFGQKKDAYELPCRVNSIPRYIPEQPWYMQSCFSIFVGGVLPFGAVFIEVFFIMSSIWLHRFYYMFGFLLLVYVILIITSAEITIVMAYFQLCAEDWHWWWRSFFTAGSSGLYLFLYSGLYFFTKLHITPFISGLLYFGYMFIVSMMFCVLTGTLGFCATFYFIRTIYGSIKIE